MLKAMKRRVGREIRLREPRVLKRGTEGFVEYGLGAVRSTMAFAVQVVPGAPVTAPEYGCVLYKAAAVRLQRNKVVPRNSLYSPLMIFHQGRFLFLLIWRYLK